MKLSEMELKLEKLLDEEQDVYWNKSLAVKILFFLEKEGMLPPYKSKDRQYPDTLTQHSWEEENEN